MAVLAYVATTQDVLEEGRDKRRVCVATCHREATANFSLEVHTQQ